MKDLNQMDRKVTQQHGYGMNTIDLMIMTKSRNWDHAFFSKLCVCY